MGNSSNVFTATMIVETTDSLMTKENSAVRMKLLICFRVVNLHLFTVKYNSNVWQIRDESQYK